jgi:NAD(P)H-quinone oxidoreductase subunit 5
MTEIGLGLRYLALIHILGHACFRTLQFLRAPTLLLDYRNLENAMGSRLPHALGEVQWYIPRVMRNWVYLLAFEKGYLDAILVDYIATPCMNLLRCFDRWERKWNQLLIGEQNTSTPPLESMDERT